MNTDSKIDGEIEKYLLDRQTELEFALNFTGSPIEKLFVLALLNETDVHFGYCPPWIDHWSMKDCPSPTPLLIGMYYRCPIFSQFPVFLEDRAAILDFAMFTDGNGGKIAIELDGHDFHERTREQAERDKSRDRLLQSDGWIVLRFAGSEIWRDAGKCARQSILVLENADREKWNAKVDP